MIRMQMIADDKWWYQRMGMQKMAEDGWVEVTEDLGRSQKIEEKSQRIGDDIRW